MTRPDPVMNEFLRAQLPSVVRAVARIVGDRELAEDAVQDAVVRYLGLPATTTIDNLAAWLTVVARNLARDRLRTRAAESRAHQRWLNEAVGDERAWAEVDDALDLRVLLGRLPEGQRRVCELRYLAGWSIEQIASDLRVTPGTVKTQLHRARRRLSVGLAA